MGIVQEQRKQIENLEAKNRMLKRMYESKRTSEAEARMAQAGAELIVKAVAVMNNGKLLLTREAIEKAKEHEMIGRIIEDVNPAAGYMFEYVIPELFEEKNEPKTE